MKTLAGNKRPRRPWLLAVLLLGLAGCASIEGGGAQIPSGGNDCFWATSIYDWRAVNDSSIVVWSPGKRCPYLVEFALRCNGIRFTDGIVFDDRDGRICPFGGDAVIVPGPGGDRCSIASIRRLSPAELTGYFGETAESEDGAACQPAPAARAG
jgi:hypothetical protein